MSSRNYTRKVLELMDSGEVEPAWLAQALAMWHSEDAMKEFYEMLTAEMPKSDEEKEE